MRLFVFAGVMLCLTYSLQAQQRPGVSEEEKPAYNDGMSIPTGTQKPGDKPISKDEVETEDVVATVEELNRMARGNRSPARRRGTGERGTRPTAP